MLNLRFRLQLILSFAWDFPPELPAGEYELRLLLYDAVTLQTVVQDGTWEPELILGRLRVD